MAHSVSTGPPIDPRTRCNASHVLPVVVDHRADVTDSAKHEAARRSADLAPRRRFEDDTEVRPPRCPAVDRFRDPDRAIRPSAGRGRLFVRVEAVPRGIDLIPDQALEPVGPRNEMTLQSPCTRRHDATMTMTGRRTQAASVEAGGQLGTERPASDRNASRSDRPLEQPHAASASASPHLLLSHVGPRGLHSRLRGSAR